VSRANLRHRHQQQPRHIREFHIHKQPFSGLP
jgi:hypothetical protein